MEAPRPHVLPAADCLDDGGRLGYDCLPPPLPALRLTGYIKRFLTMDKRIPREEFFYASWGGFSFLPKKRQIPAEGATASCRSIDSFLPMESSVPC